MAAVDFGPVPVSRFKSELPNVLTALGHQRRVLLSRHGNVVASIEPPAEQHARLLLDFATRSEDERQVPVLTMTDIGHGSPSASIRDAENGIESLLTDRGKVRGVLTSKPEADPLDLVEERAAALNNFARLHPDATPQEFADFSDSLITDPDAGANVLEAGLTWQWRELLEHVGVLQSHAPAMAAALAPWGEAASIGFPEYKIRAIQILERSDDEVGLLTNAARMLPEILHVMRPATTYPSPARAALLRYSLGIAEQAVHRAEQAVRDGRDPVVGLDFEDSTHT